MKSSKNSYTTSAITSAVSEKGDNVFLLILGEEKDDQPVLVLDGLDHLSHFIICLQDFYANKIRENMRKPV